MITTVSLNAAIDKTYYLSSVRQGEVNRVQRMYAAAGGKGINVARVLKQIGVPTTAIGVVGGHNGRWIEEELRREGIDHQFVRIDEESRININMMDLSNGQSTELLEQGPTLSYNTLEAFERILLAHAGKSEIIVISGSLPKGLPAHVYADFIRKLQPTGVKLFVDTSGETLKQALRAKPFFIKPNEDEVADLLGTRPSDDAERIRALRIFRDMGVPCVSLSLGAGGSMNMIHGDIYKVKVPDIAVSSAVGSGDAFVAGMAAGLWRDKRMTEEALKLASACGTANAMTPYAGNVSLEDVHALLPEISIEQLSE